MKLVAVILGIYKNPVHLFQSVPAVLSQSLKGYKADVYIYDNSETEGTLDELKKKFPEVTIVKNKVNKGFTGGNNSVMRKVLEDQDKNYEFIVLLNDDTLPSKNWLQNLIDSSKKDPKTGVVTSKLIYYKPFIRVSGKTQTSVMRSSELKRSDEFGIKLYQDDSGIKGFTYPKRFLREGFHDETVKAHEHFSWTREQFSFDVPVDLDSEKDSILEIKLHTNPNVNNQSVQLEVLGRRQSFKLKQGQNIFKMKLPKDKVEKGSFTLIQNTGSYLNKMFHGVDRGNSEIDEGQYNKAEEVEMFCGAAVLIKPEVLQKTGLFDEYLFMYYEDADLSFRVKKAGYKIIYEPKALVKHFHSFSSVEWSPLFYFLTNRNIIILAIKDLGPRAIYLKIRHLLVESIKLFIWIVRSGFRMPRPNQQLLILIRIFIDILIHLPSLLLKRLNIIKSK